jgi:hypothetical protein
MTSIASWEWPTARAWRPAIALATFALPMVPDNLAAQGLPVETEKRVTDQATKSLYAEEERDRAKSRRGF